MNGFTWIFLAVLGAMLMVQILLAQRHIVYVGARRRRVPSPFRGKVSLAAHRKAADYAVARSRLGHAEAVFAVIVLLLWTVGGGLDQLDQLWRGAINEPVWLGTAFLVSVVAIGALIELPVDAYRTFVIEERFGFNRTTPRLFVVDLLKGLLLMFVLGVPLAAAALWLMTHGGRLWWLYVWMLWMGFSMLMVWAYPTLIAPLFNRFRPLKQRRLRARLESLLKRTGFRSDGIYVVDSSLRTAHGNAYFTGLGRAKRIVFFDSLLKGLRDTEIEAVVAHELGHFRRGHIKKRLAGLAFMSLLALALLGWLIERSWFYAALGVQTPSAHTALALFMLVGPVFGYFLHPLLAYRSRRHEFEADDFAAEQADAGALVRALVKLYKDNAATLTPDPWHSAFYDSHPPALARIANLSAKAG